MKQIFSYAIAYAYDNYVGMETAFFCDRLITDYLCLCLDLAFHTHKVVSTPLIFIWNSQEMIGSLAIHELVLTKTSIIIAIE